MDIIHSREGLQKAKKKVARFVKVYEAAFPDVDEREDFDIIKSRIEEKGFEDDPKTFLALSANGGMVMEYYHSSGCMLLTYIAIEEGSRGKGEARDLIERSLPKVIELIRNETGKSVRGIFFEVNNPQLTPVENDSIDPWQRLVFFKKMGARRIDIPYVQPPLGEGKKRVKNLYLCCFPVKQSNDVMETSVIRDFLTSFYIELKVPEPETDPDFTEMTEALKSQDEAGKYYLKEIPQIEISELQFRECAFSYHMVNRHAGKSCEYCTYFGSFERDLFSGRFQKKPPYQSISLNPYEPLSIKILFPEKVEFASEGREETLFSRADRQSVEAKLYLAITNFKESASSVLSLTIQPQDYFTEWEMVKLSAVFGSNQENYDMLANIRFEYAGETFAVKDLIEKLYRNEVKIDLDMDMTTTSLEVTGKSLVNDYWEDLLSFLHQIGLNNEAKMAEFVKIYESEPALSYLSNALCGMTLGIYDFQRMGSDEIFDTLKPIQSYPGSSLIMNRDNIMSLSAEDSVFDSGFNTIGINPYLIIPNIILAYNKTILVRNHEALNELIQTNSALSQIEKVMKQVERSMTHCLRNVFQYPTEKTIMAEGYKEHGLNDLEEEIAVLQEDLNHRIERGFNKVRSYFDLMITFLLTAISLLQIEPMIRLVTQIAMNAHEVSLEDKLIGVFYLFSAVVIGVLIFHFGKKAYRSR
jgi:hypothetical protein